MTLFWLELRQFGTLIRLFHLAGILMRLLSRSTAWSGFPRRRAQQEKIIGWFKSPRQVQRFLAALTVTSSPPCHAVSPKHM